MVSENDVNGNVFGGVCGIGKTALNIFVFGGVCGIGKTALHTCTDLVECVE